MMELFIVRLPDEPRSLPVVKRRVLDVDLYVAALRAKGRANVVTVQAEGAVAPERYEDWRAAQVGPTVRNAPTAPWPQGQTDSPALAANVNPSSVSPMAALTYASDASSPERRSAPSRREPFATV